MTTNNKNKHRLTLFMDSLVVKHARAQAVIEDTSLSDLVSKALVDYLPHETVIRKVNIYEKKGPRTQSNS